MSTSLLQAGSESLPPQSAAADFALRIVDHLSPMLAYWNHHQTCLIANPAYHAWFGKSPSEVIGRSMRDLLGPLYELNLPYIKRALAGEVQVFERTIHRPDGMSRESLATYMPDVADGEVVGFFVHVADITPIKRLEREREELIRRLEAALQEVQTLHGLLPICMHCKSIRDDLRAWTPIVTYLTSRTDADFTHGICLSCITVHFPDEVMPD